MWIDPHAHLDDPRLDADRGALLEAARARGVGHWVIPGLRPRDAERLRALSAALGGCDWAVGLYPRYAAEATPDLEADLERAWRSGAVALGEIGLDKRDDLAPQREVFRRQLAVARDLDAPVILHLVRAHAEALETLAKDGAPRGLVHAFSGSAEVAARYVDLGLYISLCGGVTHPNARKLRRAARQIPAARLMIETDAPDQPPARLRGRLNPPEALVEIGAAVAELRGEAVGAVLDRSAAHIKALFDLNLEGA